MPPQTPFVLVDNVFDRINLNPLATLLASGATLVGREANYVADYRRERTFMQLAAAAASGGVTVDLGVGLSAVVDTCWIDRGHNLWGKTVFVRGSSDAFVTAPDGFGTVVPAQGTVGGDPTAGWSVTEEGALFRIFPAFSARRYLQVVVGEVFAPVFTGIVLGKRIQLARFSNVVDDDAGERSNRSESSLIPGYSGDDRTYSARKTTLDLKLISSTEYDSSIRTLRRLLFDVNQCAVVCMDYGTYPERTWLYKYQGNQWTSPKTRTYRNTVIQLYEYGPVVR
jgi:hypothetical protein